VWIRFFYTLAKLASSSAFSLAKSKNNWPKNKEKFSEREKNNSPDWRVGLYFYSPILNSTRIWIVGEWLSAPLWSYIPWKGLFYVSNSKPLLTYVTRS
jgi:hypothetical protein